MTHKLELRVEWIAFGMTEGMQPESFHNIMSSGFRSWGEEAHVRPSMWYVHILMLKAAPGLFLIRTVILGSFVFTGEV